MGPAAKTWNLTLLPVSVVALLRVRVQEANASGKEAGAYLAAPVVALAAGQRDAAFCQFNS